VGPRAGVEHDRRLLVGGGVQPSEHLVLGGGLADLDGEAQLLADPHAHVGEVGIRGQSVDVGLPGSEPAQIGPVEHEHFHDETSR
jgi:hypothetical protein